MDEAIEHVVADVDDDDDDDDSDDIVRLSIFAVVANCGDSRLITDNASGGTSFQSVTTDHRPSAPNEAVRLAECCRRGFGHVSCSRWTPPRQLKVTFSGCLRLWNACFRVDWRFLEPLVIPPIAKLQSPSQMSIDSASVAVSSTASPLPRPRPQLLLSSLRFLATVDHC
jgi:Protein phosphatase 2C